MSAPAGSIEIAVDFPAATKAIGKMLHAVHLDGLGQAALDAHTLHVSIDGEVSQSKLTERRVFSVEPGEHEIVVWTTGLRATRVLTERSAKAQVKADEVVALKYLYKETSAELTLASEG